MATREEKVRMKQEKANKRKTRRNAEYRNFLNSKREEISVGGFQFAKNGGTFMKDGKWMQKCSYDAYGYCEYPCNGDC